MRIERDAGHDGRALDAGKRHGALQKLLLEGADRFVLAVLVLGQHGFRDEHSGGIAQAGAHREQPVESADHEPRPDDENERERHLGDDESGARTSSRCRPRGAVLERLDQIGTAGVERGDESRDYAGGDGDP